MRKNFLISNFVAWYESLELRFKTFNENSINKEIKENGYSLLPQIMKTEISLIDEKNTIKEDNNIFDAVGKTFGKITDKIKLTKLKEEEPYKKAPFKV